MRKFKEQEQKIRKIIEDNNYNHIRFMHPDGEGYMDVDTDPEIALKDIVKDFVQTRYSLLILDDKEIILNDFFEIPEKAMEILLNVVTKKENSYDFNRLKEVSDLMDDDIWMCALLEYMARSLMNDQNLNPSLIPEDIMEELLEAHDYINPYDFNEFDIVFERSFFKVFDGIANAIHQKKEIKNLKLSMNDKFMIEKIKKDILNEENGVRILCFYGHGIDERQVERLLGPNDEDVKKEEDIDYIVTQFVISNEPSLLTFFINNGNKLEIKSIVNIFGDIKSAHDVCHVDEADDNIIVSEWNV